MKILLTEGSGLTSRQVAQRLAAAGHRVELVSSDPLCLSRFTRSVRKVHRVPAYGDHPIRWLDATLDVAVSGRFDVLFPTQEQVAVLARFEDRLRSVGMTTIVPSFESVSAVQDKVSAAATLDAAGIPQPPYAVLTSSAEVEAWGEFPVFVKEPIGSSSMGVQRVTDRPGLAAAVSRFADNGAFDQGGVVVQTPIAGDLVMAQSVFCRGTLLAAHTNLRVREGSNGGASHKRGVEVPGVLEALERLGRHLGWHGGLSADVILGGDGPVFIDINPRLVEPNNAWASGTDLVGAMLAALGGDDTRRRPPGRPGCNTHQLLLAVLGAAQHGGGRRGVASELLDAARHRGSYADSTEELTPIRRDPRAVLPVLAASAVTLARPAGFAVFVSSSVSNYALSASGWQMLLDARP